MPKIYIILGLPGAGKGVCAQELKIKKDFIHFSLGDYLREQLRLKTKIGLLNEEAISSGLSLINCEIVFNIVKSNLQNAINNDKSIVIDGFPRTIFQLKLIKDFFVSKHLLPYWIYLDIEQETAIQRLLTRQHCTFCKYDFIMVTTKEKDICDFCQKKLIKRSADNRDSLLQRIELFNQTTFHVITQLKNTGELLTIDTNKTLNIVVQEFLQVEEKYNL